MKRAMLSVVAAVAVVVIGLSAQAPPNLSGTWRPQNPNSGQVNPFEFTITQTPDSVTIRTPLNTPESLTLETSNSFPDGSTMPARTATYVKYTPVPLPAPPTRTVESGYVSLFNGKD